MQFTTCSNRREILKSGIALSLSLVVQPMTARAQQGLGQIGRLVEPDFGARFRDVVYSAGEPPRIEQIFNYASADYNLRLRIFNQIKESGVEPSSLVIEEYSGLVAQFSAADVPLVPDNKYITIEIPPIVEPPELPSAGEFVARKALVIFSIILEAMGITIDSDLVKQFIDGEPELKSQLEKIVPALHDKDWDNIEKILDFLLRKLFSPDVLLRLTNLIGPELAEKMLFKCAVRFVPFVGWVYFGLALLFALKQNWSNLVA